MLRKVLATTAIVLVLAVAVATAGLQAYRARLELDQVKKELEQEIKKNRPFQLIAFEYGS